MKPERDNITTEWVDRYVDRAKSYQERYIRPSVDEAAFFDVIAKFLILARDWKVKEAALLDAAERSNRLEEALREIKRDLETRGFVTYDPECPCVFCIAGRALAEKETT